MENGAKMKSNWSETKGKLKQKFGLLTECDMLLLKGKEDELLSRLQVKLGKTKEEVQKIISEI